MVRGFSMQRTRRTGKEFAENYKTIADYQKQTDKLQHAQDSLKTAQDGLKAFEGVDVNDLKNQISKDRSSTTSA